MNPFEDDIITEKCINSKFETSSFKIGDIVCTTNLYDELIKQFGSYEDAKNFYLLSQNLIKRNSYSKYKKSIPYFDVDIFIDSNITDEGFFTTEIERWIPNKKYLLGDCVLYSLDGTEENLQSYVLIAGDGMEKTEISRSEYDEFENEWGGDTDKDGRKIEFENNKAYLSIPCYSGYYDKVTKLTFFNGLNNVPDQHFSYLSTNYVFYNVLYKGLPKGTYTFTMKQEKTGNASSASSSFKNSCLALFYGTPSNVELDLKTLCEKTTVETRGMINENNVFEWGKTITIDRTCTLVLYTCVRNELLSKLFGARPQKPATFSINGDWWVTGIKIDAENKILPWSACSVNTETNGAENKKTYYTQSRLSDFKRIKKDVDDNCNTLPFIISYSINDEGKRVLNKTQTEMFYMPGIVNQRLLSNGELAADVMERISLYEKEDVFTTWLYYDGKTPIEVTDFFVRYKYIEFVYWVGAIIEKNKSGTWVLKKNTGIKYTERRSLTYNTYSGEINGEKVTNLPYLVVSDSNNNDINDNTENGDTNNSLISVIEYTQEQRLQEEFLNGNMVKFETTMGVHNIHEDIDVNIYRGIAHAFEKHNALGEVCTMQDLEHYRNDYFNITTT